MTEYLKGNYKIEQPVDDPENSNPFQDATDAYEQKALAKLGGSICFVSLKRSDRGSIFLWNGEEPAAAERTHEPTDG